MQSRSASDEIYTIKSNHSIIMHARTQNEWHDSDSDSNYKYNTEAGNHNSNFMKKADESMQTFFARI